MFKFMKRTLATVLTATLVLAAPVSSATSPATAPVAETKVNVKVTAPNKSVSKVTVDIKKDGTAALDSVTSKKKSVSIPSKVTVNGVKYKVTKLNANALKNCKKATKVTIPDSITTINKNAFKGAENLKTIKLNTKKNITVKKGAFKGLDTKKVTIKVNKKISKKNFEKLQKTLKKAGFKGKIKKG